MLEGPAEPAPPPISGLRLSWCGHRDPGAAVRAALTEIMQVVAVAGRVILDDPDRVAVILVHQVMLLIAEADEDDRLAVRELHLTGFHRLAGAPGCPLAYLVGPAGRAGRGSAYAVVDAVEPAGKLDRIGR